MWCTPTTCPINMGQFWFIWHAYAWWLVDTTFGSSRNVDSEELRRCKHRPAYEVSYIELNHY